MKNTHFLLGLTLVSSTLLCCFLRHTPQTLYGDPAYQLKALQQFLAGESSSFNRLTTPDPHDLTQNTTEWFSWWPPGSQLLVYPLVRCGLPMGVAVRLVVIGFLILGSVGWVLWFNLFKMPAWAQLALALCIPWLRYSNNNFFAYCAEAIAYGLTPWILWGSIYLSTVAQRRGRDTFPVVLAAGLWGLTLGACYPLKYSIVFASLAAIFYLFFQLRVISLVALLTGFAIPVALLNVINYWASHDMNPVVLTVGNHWKPLSLLWILSLPGLAMTGGYELLAYVFLHPVSGLYKHEFLLYLIGTPAELVLLWILWRRRESSGPARLAIITFVTAIVAMFGVWNFTDIGNYDGRYFAVFSLAVLPLVLEEGFSLWRSTRSSSARVGLAAVGFIYLVLPTFYGMTSVIVKATRLPSDYRYGPSHFYNGFLARQDLAHVRAQLLRNDDSHKDIWYLPEPITSLDIPGRAIICFADFIDISELQKMEYRTSAPRRIRMLLPPRLESNGKGSIIRHSFPQAGVWTRTEIPGSEYILWETMLKGL